MLDQVREQDEAVAFLRKVVAGNLNCPLLLLGREGVGRRYSVIEAAREEFSREAESNPGYNAQIDNGSHPDLLVLRNEPINIEAIRGLIEQTQFMPMLASSRYVVIDNADTMTAPASDAFLKVLEEPPRKTRFFLLAKDSSQISSTIRSRCGLIRYRALSEEFVASCLVAHVDDPGKSLVYARLSEGSIGLALQLLGSGCLTLRNSVLDLLKVGLAKDLSTLFSLVDEIESELDLALRFLEHILKDLILVRFAGAEVKASNLDILEDLGVLGANLGSKLDALVTGLSALQRRRSGTINLSFHLKSYLASVFFSE